MCLWKNDVYPVGKLRITQNLDVGTGQGEQILSWEKPENKHPKWMTSHVTEHFTWLLRITSSPVIWGSWCLLHLSHQAVSEMLAVNALWKKTKHCMARLCCHCHHFVTSLSSNIVSGRGTFKDLSHHTTASTVLSSSCVFNK